MSAGRLRLYNTLTREKEVFEPLDHNNVRMYVCGPTVYDDAHIGNARPVIVFDVLFRLLRHLYGAEHVTYVRNITDLDDKINARARQAFPELSLNEAIRRVTEETARQFHADVKALGCLEPTHEPRATEFVMPRPDGRCDMVGLIRELLHRKHAYMATGPEGMEVLFDVSSMPGYGELSKRRLDEQQAGARVRVEDHKRNPADFVLWKESGPGEPGWKATFRSDGEACTIFGRPGWHIECSAMSAAYLGSEFDIHGGGLDLIFPHHENEIAQSRCAFETPMMAKYWLHNGFLQVEGRKMAKSEGNFVTIRDLLHSDTFGGRKWPGEVLRLAMLMTNYRQPIDFSVKRLEEAEHTLFKWADACKLASGIDWTAIASRMVEPTPGDRFIEALCDDMNTVEAIAGLHEEYKDTVAGDAEAAFRLVSGWSLLGFGLDGIFAFDDLTAVAQAIDGGDVDQRVARRLAFIREKNWAEADRIRDELLADGVQLMDSKDPDTGERQTKWILRR